MNRKEFLEWMGAYNASFHLRAERERFLDFAQNLKLMRRGFSVWWMTNKGIVWVSSHAIWLAARKALLLEISKTESFRFYDFGFSSSISFVHSLGLFIRVDIKSNVHLKFLSPSFLLCFFGKLVFPLSSAKSFILSIAFCLEPDRGVMFVEIVKLKQRNRNLAGRQTVADPTCTENFIQNIFLAETRALQ